MHCVCVYVCICVWDWGLGPQTVLEAAATRVADERERPTAAAAVRAVVARARSALANATRLAIPDDPNPWHTQAEMDKLARGANETATWLETATAAQAERSAWEEPALRPADAYRRAQALERDVRTFLGKPKPKPKQKESSSNKGDKAGDGKKDEKGDADGDGSKGEL
jgi:hypothetical protein